MKHERNHGMDSSLSSCGATEAVMTFLKSHGQDGLISLEAEILCSSIFKIAVRDVEDVIYRLGLLPSRFKRNFGGLDARKQYRLFKSAVVVLGCGGLGGYIVEELARLGVGTIKVVDPDNFEEHNLNRQTLSTVDNIGKPKVRGAMHRALNVNPAVNVMPVQEAFSENNAAEILSGADVAADALDTINARHALAVECARLQIPLVHGSVGGWYGQVSVQYPGDDSLAGLFRSAVERGIEEELGIPPYTPPVVASMQCAEICRILTGGQSPLRKKLLMIDLYAMTFATLNLPRP